VDGQPHAKEQILSQISTQMQVTINNQPITCPEGMGLATLLEAERIQVDRTAIAVNGEVVPRASWADFRLSEDDEILIIQATYGG